MFFSKMTTLPFHVFLVDIDLTTKILKTFTRLFIMIGAHLFQIWSAISKIVFSTFWYLYKHCSCLKVSIFPCCFLKQFYTFNSIDQGSSGSNTFWNHWNFKFRLDASRPQRRTNFRAEKPKLWSWNSEKWRNQYFQTNHCWRNIKVQTGAGGSGRSP